MGQAFRRGFLYDSKLANPENPEKTSIPVPGSIRESTNKSILTRIQAKGGGDKEQFIFRHIKASGRRNIVPETSYDHEFHVTFPAKAGLYLIH